MHTSQPFLFRTALAAALCGGLVLLPTTSWGAPAAPPHGTSAALSPLRINHGTVEFTVSHDYTRERASTWLSTNTAEAMQDLTAANAGVGASWTIRVEILGSPFEYEIHISAYRDGSAVGPVSQVEPCACNLEELLQRVDDQVRSTIETLETPPSTPPQPRLLPKPDPAASIEAPSHPDPSIAPSPMRGGIGGLGITGLVLTAGGAALFGIGLAKAVEDPTQQAGIDEHVISNPQTPATNAMLALGSIALATGVTFVIVDLAYCRTRPRGCRSPKSSRAHVRGASLHF